MADPQPTQTTTTTAATAVTQSPPTADESGPVTKPQSLSEKIHHKVWGNSKWAHDTHNRIWNTLDKDKKLPDK